MRKYQLLRPPEEGWRGRLSIMTQILLDVFRLPRGAPPEIEPLVQKIDEVVP
jgi:hypothetical protein